MDHIQCDTHREGYTLISITIGGMHNMVCLSHRVSGIECLNMIIVVK